MNRRFTFSMATAVAVTLVLASHAAGGGGGDTTQWVDTVPASSVWNAWPTTLAVILVEFPDVTHEGFYDGSGNWVEFHTSYAWQDFWNMLASDHTYYQSPDGEAVYGSLCDYFEDMSGGAYRPNIEILNDMVAPAQPPVWYMMPHPKSYYIALGEPGSFGPLTNDAIALARADGKNVTTGPDRRICVIYAGNRRNGIGAWAYQGGSRYMAYERWKNGAQGYDAEYRDAHFSHIGVHAHEFAHLRNLAHPKSNRWSLLGDGQKNGPGPSFGACPAPLNPWFRSLDGWVTLTPITGDIENASLVYNGTPNNYKIDFVRPNGRQESFLVENRQFSSGFDRYLPGGNGGSGGPGGLLIWDILENNYWSDGYVDLIEADGNDLNEMSSLVNDPFRPDGPYAYDLICDFSTPADLKFRDGTISRFAIDGYTSNGPTITVDFKTGFLCSDDAEATGLNNGRRLLRDANGTLHFVYQAGGEIYYQFSTDGGATWSGYVRLSSGNGDNRYPCITGTADKQFVVWQRYAGYSGGQHMYDVYLAKNTGYGWSTDRIDNLSGLGFNTRTDPLPVVTYKTRTTGTRLLVCVRTSSGIKYVTNDYNGAPTKWSSPNTVPGTNSLHANPSLSMGPTTPAETVYLAYDDGDNVYASSYVSDWSSPQNISIGSGTQNNRYPSVEVDGEGGRNVAWQGYSLPLELNVVVHRRNNEAFQMFAYSGDGGNRPSITGLSANRRVIVCTSDGYTDIYRSYFNGSSWSHTLAASNGHHPSLSAGTPQATYVWTSRADSPYEIKVGGETLSKATELSNVAYHRASVLEDSTGSSLLWVEVGEIQLRTDGGYVHVPLCPVQGNDLSLTTQSVFDYLKSEPFLISEDVDSLLWRWNIYARGVEPLAAAGASSVLVRTALVEDATGHILAALETLRLDVAAVESRGMGAVSAFLGAHRGKFVRLRVLVDGVATDAREVVPGLVEVHFLGKDRLGKQEQGRSAPTRARSPGEFVLSACYPNPFNPETTVQYAVPYEARVSIEVYNLLGQKIVILVDRIVAPGRYSVRWDGRDTAGPRVTAGIYLCRMRAREFTAVRKMTLLP